LYCQSEQTARRHEWIILNGQERAIAAIVSIPLIGYDRLRTRSSFATLEITKEQVAQSGNISGINA
jgi:hypothetical protein